MEKRRYFAEQSAQFAVALEALRGTSVVVLGHVRPDGDCIGSQVALTRVLRATGVDAVALNQHRIPPNCQAFVGDTPFQTGEDSLPQERVAVSVDCADHKRLGAAVAQAFPQVALNIDHHISNSLYAATNIIVGSSSATGELLAGMILDNGLPLDAVTAQALYVGIATDTGQFRFSSTTIQTFDICRELLAHGADPAAAALELYERESPAKLALLQQFISSFRYYCGGKACVGVIDDAAWQATGADKEDTEGLVDYARSIDGVEIGVLLEQNGGQLKGSFRAKDPVHRVDLLARQFNGGGHACAAGFNPECGLDELHPRLIAALEDHFRKLQAGD
jgi:phosphoesterase RecJ-like protein